MLGLGLSIPQVAARGSRSLVAAIRSLFAANEPGVWYDPSDLSTLFQDSAGTTPVTAVEQPVGLMLDKSKGLVLGPELVTNGDFSDGLAGWSQTGTTWSPAGGTAKNDGTSGYLYKEAIVTVGALVVVECTVADKGTAGSLSISLSNGGATASFSSASLVNGQRVSVRGVKTFNKSVYFFGQGGWNGAIDNISVRELPGNHASQTTATSRPVLSARVNQYLATETLATQNVTTLAAQYRLSFEGAGTITLSGTATGVYSAGSHLITCTTGTLTSTVSGSVTKADLRVANDGANLPPYQRVNTETDYDTVGFPHYLRFDGVDDWMVTNTITPGIDKVQVFAGVRRIANGGIPLELSATVGANAGSFYVFAGNRNNATGSNWTISSRGDTADSADQAVQTAAVYSAPLTSLLTGLFDIAGDSTLLRINGSQVGSATGDQGSGNYLAYPLYIGRRGGTTLPFNGHLYSLIVRFGSNLPTATIEKTEKYINTKTRAY